MHSSEENHKHLFLIKCTIFMIVFCITVNHLFNFFINFAGTPHTKELGGNDLVTTLPEPTTIFSLNSTPRTVEFAPK